MMLLLLIFCPTLAFASPVTYDFTGNIGDSGTFSGSLTYETTAPPIATNVRGLLGNAVYQPLSWAFTITPNLGGELTQVGSTIEFCEGKCLFGVLDSTTLRVGSTDGVLQLAFTPDFGSLIANASSFKTGTTHLLVSNFNQVGGVAAPEPSSYALLALALVLMPCLRQWWSYSMRRLSSQET